MMMNVYNVSKMRGHTLCTGRCAPFPGKTIEGLCTSMSELTQGQVDTVFDRVASRYDLMNDILSLGMHRLWKDALVSCITAPRAGRAFHVLDVASGSGDIVHRIARRATAATQIVASDINPAMLDVGRARLAKTNTPARLRFVRADGAALPFADKTFHVCVIAFGIRNIPALGQALCEAHRVLRRGGHFLCLEFSQCDIPPGERIYQAYGKWVIPAIGRMVVGDAAPYEYLVRSIRSFPTRARLARQITGAGFDRVSVRPYSGGIACLHQAWKF